MTDEKKYTITLTVEELDTVRTGLEDTAYWRAAPEYRKDGHPLEPYHDDEPEEAERCRMADALHDKLGPVKPDEP